TIAAGLALAGEALIGIARGAQLEAIVSGGLQLRTPAQEHRVDFQCVATPAAIDLRDDEVVILTMKTQNTHSSLLSIRSAGGRQPAIVCDQNGVANERMALRLFPNVDGAAVVLPATYEVAGIVNAFGIPKRGLLYLGRHPEGAVAATRQIASGFQR